MNGWAKSLLVFPVWFFFLIILYGIVLLIFPNAISGNKLQFDSMMSNNFGFLISSQLAIVLSTFFAVLFLSKVIDKKWPDYLKSLFNFKGIIFGITFSLVSIFAIVLIISLSDSLRFNFREVSVSLVWYLIVFFLVALGEEVLSRGFILDALINQTNIITAIIFSSLIFSFMHFFNSNFSWVGFLNIFLVGILFSQFFLMKNNLSIPIGFHFGWNFIQGPILGFSVSGFPTNSVIEVVDNSYHEFNFGGFGLEGSLACTSILICLIALIFFLHTKKAIKFYSERRRSLKHN